MSKLWIGLIDKQSNGGCLRNDFMQQFEPFRRYFRIQGRNAGNIAAGPVETGNETDRHGIEAGVEDNRNGRGRRLGCKRAEAMSGTTIRATFRLTRSATNSGSRSCWLSAMKCGHGLPRVTGRFAVEESNDRHLRLLRARRKRPSSRRAAEQRDELAALQ